MRPRYREWLRHGWTATSTPKRLPVQRDGCGEEIRGTAGWSHHSDPARVLRIVQEMVQQGWADSEIATELMKPVNVGSVWLRRRDDPDAALADMLARVDRSREPHLPMRERQHRIMVALSSGGEVWQKSILRHVGHPYDRDVRNDLLALVQVGAIQITEVLHGLVVWRRFRLAVTPHAFWDWATQIRKDLARKIGLARMKARAGETWRRAQGCLSDTAGRAPDPASTDAKKNRRQTRPQELPDERIERALDAAEWAELRVELAAIVNEASTPDRRVGPGSPSTSTWGRGALHPKSWSWERSDDAPLRLVLGTGP